jgi:hypothetical protein
MKKIVLLLLVTINTFAQKRYEKEFVCLGPIPPIDATYSDARYCKVEYNFPANLTELMRNNGVTGDDLKLNGVSNKPESADFVVKYTITRFEFIDEKTIERQPAFVFGFEGNVRVYDATNKLIFQRYLKPTKNAFLENFDVKIGQSLRHALSHHFYNLVADFSPYFLWGPVVVSKSVGLTKLPKNSDLTDVNQSVAIFENLIQMKHSDRANAFQPAVDYWVTLKTYDKSKDDDVIKDVKLVSYYNTAMAYLLQGKINEAEELLPMIKENDRKFLGSTLNSSRIEDEIKSIKERIETQKDLAKIEPIEQEPVLAEYQKGPNVFKYMELEGTALDKKGINWVGTIRIWNDSHERVNYFRTIQAERSLLGAAFSAVGAAIADNLGVFIYMKDVKKPEKMSLDDIISIKTKDGKDYTVAKIGSFVNTDLHYGIAEQISGNDNIGLYSEVFPGIGNLFIKRPSDEKPFRYNQLSPKKSLQEYFANCPAMTPFITNKEYKAYDGKQLYNKLMDLYVAGDCK